MGYMTVGEAAKKMNLTVRTLQYYDKVGLLPPSTESEGGLRLYTDKEIVRLYQIRAMKRLGFSLDEIKAWLASHNTPEDLSAVLLEQASEIRVKIKTLTDVLESVEKLNIEVIQTKEVDWGKYTDILALLESGSQLYWAAKHLPDSIYEKIDRVDEVSPDLIKKQNALLDEADLLRKNGEKPGGKKGQAFAEEFWKTTQALAGGDTGTLVELAEIGSTHGDEKWQHNRRFIGESLNIYLESQLGYNPLKGGEKQ